MNKNNKIWTEVFEKAHNNYSPETPIINGTGELSAQQNEGEASGFASISLNNGEAIIGKFVENGEILLSTPFSQLDSRFLDELDLSPEERELVKDFTYMMVLTNMDAQRLEKKGLKPQSKLIVTILDSSKKDEFTIEKDFVKMAYNEYIGNIPYHFIKTREPEDPQFRVEGKKNSCSYILEEKAFSKNISSGNFANAEGQNTIASGEGSHAEGYETTASGEGSHTEGYETTASGDNSHAEGYRATAWGEGSHAEGFATKPNGIISSQEIDIVESSLPQPTEVVFRTSKYDSIYAGSVYSIGNYLYHAYDVTGGYSRTVKAYVKIGTPAPPLGIQTIHKVVGAIGLASHAEGYETTASGDNSHAEGSRTMALGKKSHAEGYYTLADGESSHAEGDGTTASGESSHAEGSGTNVSSTGTYSHAEGLNTIAKGANGSHAEGQNTTASGVSSHAEGLRTTASGDYSHAEGKFNVDISSAIHMVGIGNQKARKNAHTITTDGKHYIPGIGTYQGIEDGSAENPLPVGQDLATIVNGKLTTKNVTVTGTGNVISNVTIGNDSVTFSKDKTIHESNLKQSHEPTETTAEITPNILHVWGVVAELNITFKVPTDTTIVNEYMFQFSTGQTPVTLTLPSTIKWLNGEAPIIGANRTYQISVVDNLAVFGGF